ncbi:MAG: AsmA-like C-terminal domain-containing protein, partial [Geminicoccaceae bacterium]
HKDLEPSEVRVQAKAQLHDAAISKLRERFDVDGGELELSVDRESAKLSGSAHVDGVPLEIDWQENFADDAALERSFHLQGDVPADALARFGIEPPLPVQGSFGLEARVEETAGRRQVYLALDLEPLAFSLPWLAWQKARGQAGRLEAVLAIPEQGPIGVESFSVSGPDLNIMGTMQLQAEPLALISADIESFRLARSQGSLVVQSDPEGTYRVTVEALSLDLGRLLEMRDQATSKEPSGGPSGEPTPFRLELSADTVLLDGQSLRAVHADLARDRSGWRSADVDARLSSGGTVALRLVPENGQRHLTVTSGDAGALLEALDQSSRIEGGRLKIDAVIRRQVPTLAAEGIFQVKDFKLLDAPALARLLTLASLTGIGNLLGGEGIFFDRLELPFTLQDRVITIDEGRMSGSQLGLTAEGRIELDPARLELDGTIVPVYTLNKVIGNIPLLGPFLTGSEGEGAFAATYSMKGDPGEPEITVNPLSVLAPGFLRELFSGLLEGSLQPPEVRSDDK